MNMNKSVNPGARCSWVHIDFERKPDVYKMVRSLTRTHANTQTGTTFALLKFVELLDSCLFNYFPFSSFMRKLKRYDMLMHSRHQANVYTS